jgi:hypothetical protein
MNMKLAEAVSLYRRAVKRQMDYLFVVGVLRYAARGHSEDDLTRAMFSLADLLETRGAFRLEDEIDAAARRIHTVAGSRKGKSKK